MLALLIGTLLFLSPAENAALPDACDSLYAAALEAYQALDTNRIATVHALLHRSKKARICKGNTPSDVLGYLYHLEIYALQLLGERRAALFLLDDYERLFVTPPDSSTLGWRYSTRANLNYYLNNLSEAARNFSKTLALTSSAQPFRRAKLLLDFADTLQRLRDFPAARRHRIQAARLLQPLDKLNPAWRRLRIRLLHGQADLLYEATPPDAPTVRDSLQKAILLANEWLALAHDAPPDDQTVWAHTLLGAAFTRLGEAETALSQYERAMQLAREFDKDDLVYGVTNRLGRFYTQIGQFDKAEEILLKALSLMDAAPHLDHDRRTLHDVGYLYELRGEPARAEAYYLQAMDVTEQYHESLRLTDWSAQALADWQAPFRGLIRVLLAQGRFIDAFLVLERTRARHLQDLRTQSQLLRTLSGEERVRFDSLTHALSETLSSLATDILSTTQVNALSLRKTQLITERRALLHLNQAVSFPSLDLLQHALADRKQVILSYFIDAGGQHPARPARSYAFVVTPDTVRAVPLRAPSDTLQTLLAEVSPLLLETDTAPEFDEQLFSLSVLKELYDRLFAPIASYLPEQTRLVIIPDGPLFMLPFGMLIEDEAPAYQYRSAPFLLRKHPISVELATALMLNAPSTDSQAAYDIMAFGKADFAETGQPDALGETPLNDGPLINLPAVNDELDAIAALFSRQLTRRNAEATEGAFFDLSKQGAKILHLASHTLLRSSSPLHNAIVLSKDPADPRFDGLLFLHEIQRQQLASHLVVLSGCNTARGIVQPGEGMAGLQYAFRAMGVQSSLATSWFVQDKTALFLIETFYANLQKGLPKDVALQHAQLAYLDRAADVNASPFFWAAPVLYGNTAAMTLERPIPLWLLGLGTTLLFTLMLYLAHRLYTKVF